MKIAFLESFLNIRGTTVSLYDYAHFSETILGHESIILTEPFENRSWHPDSSIRIHEKFTDRFPVIYFNSHQDIQEVINRENVDILYIIKSGKRDGRLDEFENVKTIIHCVFEPVEPHGDCYCVISKYLNLRYRTHFPVLPHIVNLPNHSENYREELGIPMDAIVFGRYGGITEFDLPEVQNAVRRISKENPKIYFLFMNTKPFTEVCENILYMDRTTDFYLKTKFINTCDAMIYGRKMGESFGLAIGEFSSKNKPIIAPTYADDTMHQMILQKNAIWFEDEEDCCEKLRSFEVDVSRDWNMYREYSPENVMMQFSRILESLE